MKQNNKVIILGLLVLIALSGCSTEASVSKEAPATGYAQASLEPDGVHDCPKDLIGDEYPGSCRLYKDANNDGICDHSQ